MAVPTSLYGSETWEEQYLSKRQASEMNFLRYGKGSKVRQRIRNKDCTVIITKNILLY